MNILVIDDEKIVLSVLEIALTSIGHKVVLAQDGREGIRKFDEEIFDLVITDLIMPKIDGNGVIDHIRNSERKKTPIIGISGTPWELESHCLDSILAKPFPLKILLEKVEYLAASNVN